MLDWLARSLARPLRHVRSVRMSTVSPDAARDMISEEDSDALRVENMRRDNYTQVSVLSVGGCGLMEGMASRWEGRRGFICSQSYARWLWAASGTCLGHC